MTSLGRKPYTRASFVKRRKSRHSDYPLNTKSIATSAGSEGEVAQYLYEERSQICVRKTVAYADINRKIPHKTGRFRIRVRIIRKCEVR